MDYGSILAFVQFFFAVVIGLYFWNLLKAQQGSKVAVRKESRKEQDRLASLRSIALTEPLSERTRPQRFEDIVGQEEGLRALRAALCGPNPQHVLIYGPPGVGKTAAARLVLEEAKRNPRSPFRPDAAFVEIDATTARFDERGIADPLIGSVHDPIYQGAGPLGVAGIPQPKPGAVTRAHGGILFIDEIGELHPVQMNKLLKVLEDRKVLLESAYYNPDDPNLPAHIKDAFENGLPADFRLVGATTRMPEEIPPAIRSRCVEIFFRPLAPEEVGLIARRAAARLDLPMDEGAVRVIERYARNGREAVNIVQIAAGLAETEGRRRVTTADVEWVVNTGQYTPRPERRVADRPQVGVAHGLAVYGPNLGTLIEIEVVSSRAATAGQGRITMTGVIDEEEFGGGGRPLKRRKSTARGSVENVLAALRPLLPVHPADYDLHINFPGGIPLDGPSAGACLAAALYSALTGVPVDNQVAITGEVTARGLVRAVGGIQTKVAAARQAGARRVVLPRENWQESLARCGLEVIPVSTVEEVLRATLVRDEPAQGGTRGEVPAQVLTAAPRGTSP
ncbi:Sigma 54 interacting domain protein [Thermaerobacter marianensis DSM 12885]|uniref:endopeptidase La n=1 Tax=Thermaerobacter marianensis (strain ATCC 700841 / DSM 12885 / JCM 10246 / 7p75a) TaxID=644966 RepID=E6SKT0_THEM7|nr:ATP-dependent protease LonB [Thermaerobacter marianensis]ADU52303.1 Sigma 54 interacting domain protein [Thermaerobacter marianensis DSM 12885]